MVTFAAAPAVHQEIIQKTLTAVGLVGGVGVTANGVNVYSVRLAQDLGRFKVSGVGQEEWMFPEVIPHKGEWLAGLLDADGTVRANQRVIYYQKPHGGLDKVAEILEGLGVSFTRHRRPDRNLEDLEIRKESRPLFQSHVQPRFPRKAARFAFAG